jgi:hypothetical protein
MYEMKALDFAETLITTYKITRCHSNINLIFTAVITSNLSWLSGQLVKQLGTYSFNHQLIG